MVRIMAICGALAIATLLSGCRARQLAHDQDHMRKAIVNLHTEQVMHNLVLAYTYMPFVQMDYTRTTGTVSQETGGSAGGSYSDSDSLAGATISSAISSIFNYGVSASKENQLTVTAEPVLNNNEVYAAYFEFLKPEPGRGPRLIESPDAPPCEAYHMVKRCGDYYYWVPKESAKDFQRLALVTTVLRGEPLSAPRAFTATIATVTIGKEIVPAPNSTAMPGREISLKFTSELPNDEAVMRVTLGDRKLQFKIFPVDTADDKTDTLRSRTPPLRDTSNIGLSANQAKALLEGASVSIEYENHRPTIKRTTELLEDIRAENELQRLLLNRTR